MAGVVGRDAELSAIRAFVGSISEGAAALVLEGEAGMGKTTLWSEGVAFAEEGALRVLRALPAESETALSFSGLGDLLDPVLEEALDPLPRGQRSALARALVLEEAEGSAPDAHSVGVAVLSVLRALADKEPVVVAVDDLQWLDGASAGALAYAARRLRSERVGVLLSRRSPPGSPLADELRRSMPDDRLTEIDVGPLDIACLHGVVHDHLGVTLPRPLLNEVHQASGGNPFYALEIARMLRRTGAPVEAGQPLPVPASLHDLVHVRLLALPRESRDFLTAAASHAYPTIAVTESASGVDRDVGLRPVLEARIVELQGDRIRFTHPLLAAGAYETADPGRRREIHARLADLLENPEARAWQLCASVEQPDERVAAALEDAARHARARGAPRPAALLLDRARQLTPHGDQDEIVRRAADASYLHFESGDSRRAEAQLREVIRPLVPGRARAGALSVLARIRSYDAPREAVELFLQVVEEAEGDTEILSAAHEGVASCLYFLLERLNDSVRHAQSGLALALERGDEAGAADVLIAQLGCEALLGRAEAVQTAEMAAALQRTANDRRLLDQPLIGLAEYWSWIDAPERARDALLDLLQRAEELGDESSRPFLLSLLAGVHCLLGDFPAAHDCAREGHEAAEQSGQPLFAASNLAVECLVCAQQGSPEAAQEAGRSALALMSDGLPGLVAAAALGHLELALGNPEVALERLEPSVAVVRREGIVEPGATRFVVDQVEALVELGRLDEAVELLDWYEGNARRLERASALAACARCRGLISASAARLDDAVAAYEEALALHERVELPLDRGRTLLALGMAQRRAKRRRAARATLEEALGVFERIGAALWAERARGELQRISGRAATPGALTPSEQRVAALVAEGKTNREVAAALFLSERTVEGHLSHAFGKLGVRSRTELARVLGATGREVTASNTGDSPVSGDSAAP